MPPAPPPPPPPFTGLRCPQAGLGHRVRVGLVLPVCRQEVPRHPVCLLLQQPDPDRTYPSPRGVLCSQPEGQGAPVGRGRREGVWGWKGGSLQWKPVFLLRDGVFLVSFLFFCSEAYVLLPFSTRYSGGFLTFGVDRHSQGTQGPKHRPDQRAPAWSGRGGGGGATGGTLGLPGPTGAFGNWLGDGCLSRGF